MPCDLPASLRAVATAVLAVAVGGCCSDVEDETVTNAYDGIAAADRYISARDEFMTDEERCEAACVAILQEDFEVEVGEIVECSAVGDVVADDPWGEMNTQVTIACVNETTMGGFCTGRRPQGHDEAGLVPDGIGSWLAIHAHLERASVTAFEELAAWLQQQGAPVEFVERCREARRDEVRHARIMARRARDHGVDVPPARADPPRDELLAVALHNAVEGCVHEAFAAIIAMHQSAHAAADLRPMFEAIALDELEHGQLAWDLHTWLMRALPPAGRERVATALARALSQLPARAEANARATPAPLGWPDPRRAAAMARRFATQLGAA